MGQKDKSSTIEKLELRKHEIDAETKRQQIRAGLLKVILGTTLVGIATVFFPFARQYATVYYAAKVEILKADHAQNLKEKEFVLDQQIASARITTLNRDFLDSVAKEGRSKDLEDRIILAEYYAFLANEGDEQKRWKSFLDHLIELRSAARKAEIRAEKIAVNPKSTAEEKAESATKYRQLKKSSETGGVGPVIRSGFVRPVPIPKNINRDLSSLKRSLMVQNFGPPREHLDRKCRSVTNPRLRDLIVTEHVGPFRVTGIGPAVKSLRSIFSSVRKEEPELYKVIGSVGMLCVRYVSNTKLLSNHSWGTAIDISIDGALDGIKIGGGTGRRDGKTLAGLAILATFFNEEGWYWGVKNSVFENGIHFEISNQKLLGWIETGEIEANLSAADVPEAIVK